MVNTDYEVKLLADGLLFGESPRWRDGKLYVSDMTGKKLWVIDDKGNKESLIDLPNQVNGSCFNDQGLFIYGTMFDGQLWSYNPKTGKHEHYADMSKLMTGYTGDAVIDAKGRMYVDDVGARVLHGEEPRAGRILLVEPDGQVKSAHEDIVFPNGINIDSTGENLYVIETFAFQLNHFEIREDGSLYDRKVIWNIKEFPVAPGEEWTRFHSGDGFCMDAEDYMWLSMLGYRKFIRREPKTGEITDVIEVDGEATACILGGDDGKTLYLVVNKTPSEGSLFDHMVQRRTKGTIYTTRVKVGKGKARP
jgi:sugar lactone lactonase YvrE